MKNYFKIIIAIVIIIIVGAFVYYYKTNNTMPLDDQPSITTGDSIVGCYIVRFDKDIYTLTVLSEQGESFEGTLSFKNFEKDSSSGTFRGTYKNGILLGNYSFNSEGTDSVMEVIFKKSGNGFIRGYGDTTQEGTRFADINKVTYDSSYVFETSTECININ